MCGIFGLVSNLWISEAELAAKMIKHRGPDDYGICREESLCLIHYRLAIQDLSAAGHQPMWSADGRYCILVNGEIYNHWELRKELDEKYKFKSQCDAETMLYAFVEWNTDSFKRLNGIFAAVIYDKLTQELFIVRDPLGVKPCYYLDTVEGFAFCSELKAFDKLSNWDRSLDYPAIFNYLNFLWSPGEQTPFKWVKKLLPGNFLRYNISKRKIISCTSYYKIPFDGTYDQKTEEEWVDLIDLALQKAVSRQLLSDVPVAYFISGGLDSSLIAAIARTLQPNLKLKGYTINSQMQSGADGFADDLPYAKQVARLLNIDLEIVSGELDYLKEFEEMVIQLDEPQADVAPIYVAHIAKEARKNGYYVLIGGVGGDDLFAGYRRHQAARYDAWLMLLPSAIRNLICKVGVLGLGNGPRSRRFNKFLSRHQYESIDTVLAENYRWMDRQELLKLFSESIKRELESYDPTEILVKNLAEIPEERNALNKLLFWDMKFFLGDHNLNYSDKASMQYGVELRVPFLDLELIELSTRIPPELKIKNGISKYLLKKVAERYLPHEIIYRSKTGFGAPIRKWIVFDHEKEVSRQLEQLYELSNYALDKIKIKQLLLKNKTNQIDASYCIQSLLSISFWLKKYCNLK